MRTKRDFVAGGTKGRRDPATGHFRDGPLLDRAKRCPKCGNVMVVRQPKRGSSRQGAGS